MICGDFNGISMGISHLRGQLLRELLLRLSGPGGLLKQETFGVIWEVP